MQSALKNVKGMAEAFSINTAKGVYLMNETGLSVNPDYAALAL
jgi:hypothetical protein